MKYSPTTTVLQKVRQQEQVHQLRWRNPVCQVGHQFQPLVHGFQRKARDRRLLLSRKVDRFLPPTTSATRTSG